MIQKEQTSIIFITLLIVFLGIILAVIMGFRYSIPISKLMMATRETSNGNYRHKVILKRNDELGNLATAFNEMNEKLWKNSLMQESFGKYVGSEILEMIMANPQNTWLKGHRNEATILFADIRGFTSYSDSKEPEQVVAMLNKYFEIATNAILEYGGYVDKFVGDAVLGVFGVPVYRKNHVERAVKAAFRLQQKLQEASKTDNKLYAAVGIGIDTGIVVSGNIGSQAKMEYTVIGDSVNVASRLNGLARSGEIIISRNVVSIIKEIIEIEALPVQNIKGKTQPIEVFKVLNIHERSNVTI
jgi:adenylate cyclase